MKKSVILSAFFIWVVLGSRAQSNGGFENWTSQNTYENPDYWETLNIASTISNPVSAFKATGIDKHSGNYALKIKTIFFSNNPVPNLLWDTMGYAFLGKINVSPPSTKMGTPYTGRPEKLEFWAKYIPVGADVGGATVVLQKWNGTNTDTIADGYLVIDTTMTYTFFQVNLFYYSTVLPDTLVITFASSLKKANARVGSTLYIDDVALTGWVGVDEHNNFEEKVKVFPNPAKESVTISAKIKEADNIQVVDASGKPAGGYKIQNDKTDINTSQFAEGFYLYEIRDKKNKILTTGKFNVVK